MFRASSKSPVDKGTRMPVVQAEESKQPLQTRENKAQSTPDFGDSSGATNISGIQVHGSPGLGPASLAKVQEGGGVQDVEQSDLPGDGERVHVITSSPETIHYTLKSNADSETVDSGFERAEHTVSYVTTTTTEVEERKGTDVRKAEESATARESTVQQRKAPFYQETRLPAVTETGRSPPIYSAAKAVEPWGFTVPSKSMPNSALERLLQIQRLHREEKERILDLEYEDYKRFYEEQFEVFQTANEGLLRELSASASQIALLKIQLGSLGYNLPGTASQHDKVDSTIATTITTITTRIELWKHAVAKNKGQITISNNELEQLLSDLSTASSQMTELQQNYGGLSRDFSSVRHELQVMSSLQDEKDRTIATLTAEVAQWKHADAVKAQQITAVRRDNEMLRRDLSAASSRTTGLQQRHDAQSRELGSTRKELQTKASLIGERDRAIASVTTEVARWKQLDVTKGEQIATARRDSEELLRDSSASSHIAELQKCYDVQSKELGSARNELQVNKSLIEEKDRTITTLTAEVSQWKFADVTKAEEFAAEHRDKEQLQRDLAAFSSQTADFQKRYDAQSKDIVTIRNELQTKTSLLEEKEFTIISLTTEVAQAKREDSEKAERIATVRREVELLRRELSSASDRFTELQARCTTKSQELNSVRDELRRIELYFSGTNQGQVKPSKSAVAQQITIVLEEKNKEMKELHDDLAVATSRNTELQRSFEEMSIEVRAVRDQISVQASQHESTTASLTAQVEQWKRADAMKEEQIASIRKQVEKLQHDLSTSISQVAGLQSRCKTRSSEFVTVRNELQAKTWSGEVKNRTIASLTAEVNQWKLADANKAEQIATTVKQVGRLQRDLSASASKLAELQGRYAAQSRELISVRNELQTRTSSDDDKDRTVTALSTSSQIAELSQRYELRSRELGALQDQLQDKVSDKDRYASLLSQVAEWKRSDATKEDKLATVRKDLEQFRRDLATSSSQIMGWKWSDATKTEELAAAQKDIEQLRRDLSTSSSQLVEYHQRYAAQSAELTSHIEQWKRSDAAKVEELATARKKIEQLQHDLSASSSRVAQFQQRYEAQSAELSSVREQLQATLPLGGDKDPAVATLNAQIEQWKLPDAAKAVELEQLQRKLSASSSELDVLRQSISKETRRVYEKITAEEEGYSAIIKLTTTVDEWLRADAKRAEELAMELAKRNKENEKLRYNLVTLKEIYIHAPALKQIFQSETIEIQKRYEEQLGELKFALAERQSQLDGVQRFVTTADIYADTMIIQMLQKFNAEVQQNTTFMAECMLQDFQIRTTKLTKEQSSAMNRVSESIGQTLTGCLGSKERDDVALYLSIAFQAYLTCYLHSVISSWTIKKDRDEFINEIYERLQKYEAQTISGRWRSLTHTYISPTFISDPDALMSGTVSGLSDIVVAAGCAASLSTARSKISSRFGDKVASIISIAGQLSRMIGEVVSADFEVLFVRPVQMFDETTMEEDMDDYDEGQGVPSGTATGQKVLCSTQLGITKQMQLESGDKDRLTVMKAKVILESFLDG